MLTASSRGVHLLEYAAPRFAHGPHPETPADDGGVPERAPQCAATTAPSWAATRQMTGRSDAWAEALAPQLYGELKVLAHAHLRREREGHTLGTTALVHEAWLRLSASESIPPEDASRFFAMAAATMRRVLLDHARRVRSQKRGLGVTPEPLDVVEPLLSVSEAEELVSLDDALERLAAIHPRAALAVQLRFFGGLSESEAATALEVSPKTIRRDWLAARAWLRKEVAHDLGLLAEVEAASD